MADKQIGDIAWSLEIWLEDFGTTTRFETLSDESSARTRAQEILDTEPSVVVIYLEKKEVVDMFER